VAQGLNLTKRGRTPMRDSRTFSLGAPNKAIGVLWTARNHIWSQNSQRYGSGFWATLSSYLSGKVFPHFKEQ
jgi:hypothetical protein